jgi:hypothetical protein
VVALVEPSFHRLAYRRSVMVAFAMPPPECPPWQRRAGGLSATITLGA